MLLCADTRSCFKTLVVLLAVPFSAMAAIGPFHMLGLHVSIAAWVGMIVQMGLDAERTLRAAGFSQSLLSFAQSGFAVDEHRPPRVMVTTMASGEDGAWN